MLQSLKSLNEILWGTPLLCILIGTHLFFTFHLKFIQKHTLKAIRLSAKSETSAESSNDTNTSHSSSDGFSGFGALATTLAATLGTGNIVGVSTAVYSGGPGAVLWCWLTGILGMATTYAECFLSVKYQQRGDSLRDSTEDTLASGELFHRYGGPMYVLKDGLHSKGLAGFYAFCVLISSFGAGCTTQSNSLAETASYLWHLPTWLIGMITAVIVGFVLVAGVSSIEKFCMKLVPVMGFLFLSTSVVILILNFEFLWKGLVLIFTSAFSPKAVGGGLLGATAGYSIKSAARYGIARGLFTNEAGLGTAGITAAGSTAKPTQQALISMTATFWDTVVCCAITGLVIVTNMLRFPESIQGVSGGNLVNIAFEVIPYIGGAILGVCMVLFALATLIGWSYMGQQAFSYLFHKRGTTIYQIIYLVMIFLGAVLSLDLVWELTDTINFFMVIPNLIALYGLRKEIEMPKD